MNSRSTFFLSCLSVALLLTSCTSKKEEQRQTDLVTFSVRGEIVEIDTLKSRVVVAHEEIPDFMAAMTMPFKVKNRKLLKQLSVGDSISATLAISRTESWLETITVVGKGEPPDPQLVAGAITSRILRTGDEFPNDVYVNHDGKEIRFNRFKGKVVALTFIYTRCPLPDFCILISNNFARLQALLKKEASLNGKWHIMTVSFDPKFDTPQVLKEYGASYNADFTTWDFVTDPDTSGRAIMRLADGLGLTYENDDGGLIAHNLRTVVLDREGKIAEVIHGNEWKPEEVAEQIRNIALQ